jgi:hypothetical protein
LLDWFSTEAGFHRVLATPYRLSMTGWKEAGADPDAPIHLTVHRPRSIAPLEAAGVEIHAEPA